MKKILVANDDGVYSLGIRALANALADLGDVTIVAPEFEQSGVGHGITIRRPLRFKPTKLEGLHSSIKAFRVDGTPTDCVVMGVHQFGKPDLVVSGINYGPNLGYDLTHSGTFACAIEGTHIGVPSIAFSQSFADEMNYVQAAAFAKVIAAQVLESGLPAKTVLNVNVPTGIPKGVRVTVQGTHHYEDSIAERLDPEGKKYYWVGGVATGDSELDSDYTALEQGFISVTPLRLDFTHHDYMKELRSQAKNWVMPESLY
jgi:5'-nucleotidase